MYMNLFYFRVCSCQHQAYLVNLNFSGNYSRADLGFEKNLFGCRNNDSWCFHLSLQGLQQDQLRDVAGDSVASH